MLTHGIRRLQAMLLGHNVSPEKLYAELEASSIPVSTADCRTCQDPCDEGHLSYGRRFDVDMETQLLGSIKPYRRQVIISTGKSDWDRDVTDTKGSLAAHIHTVAHKAAHSSVFHHKAEEEVVPASLPHGIYRPSDSTKISILNGNHTTVSEDHTHETVLILPDYKVVTGVPSTLHGAEALYQTALDPSLGRTGIPLEKGTLKTWVLPYSCLILLCSHKRRDNRCGLSAPKLEQSFIHSLEHHGWMADTKLEDPSLTMDYPLEEVNGTEEDREAYLLKHLKDLPSEKKALILRNSHIGGHKYAGNCIIYTPQGASVWYGRITPHEIESIVVNTIIGGLVLPPLLRGGINLSRPGCSTLNDW
ncbi:hypothetical protein PC9H_005239 [Pleurotus ostreatus]|uniref:Uncharacterized protein n=1 Tax=Pleurotus ostreatus TaxID=5322 RepID=A0A8H6ZYP1_PLEOS|nr:uncharacterized protein PC9H_005239 [Pleurotus ostreatus]KAF7433289.1 hypothetical protein PC9H_005239 [Pleurotus ostreatus]